MTHLPDCDDYAFSGAGYHPNCERICICRQVRRIEQRVLVAAREAVDSMVIETAGDSAATVDQALAAIDALKEPREFYGRWKYSKRAGAWVWKWKRRKVRQVDTAPHNPLEHINASTQARTQP